MVEKGMMSIVNPSRAEKYKNVIARRQNMTVILENVDDPHNIGAVIRSCDAVGISEVYILYTVNSQNLMKKKIGKNTSSGTRKWIKPHYYGDLETCISDVRKKYSKIYGTHLSTESASLYDLDLTQPIALMFGNEHLGLSDAALKLIDGNFIIPQHGMVQSLNISVACAVSLFEAARQRSLKNMYAQPWDESNPAHVEMFDWFAARHLNYLHKKEK
jgi:tRNA (guanosine-2'-O-)-methyltransferase